MKRTTLAAMAILAGTNLSAKDVKAFTHTVEVCTDRTSELLTLLHAETIAGRMFAGIGIKIEWPDPSRCPPRAIRVGLSTDTPAALLPRSLAYALPYEGCHIVIFYDRIAHTPEAREFPALLAHVMAHELTHILEGVSRHSREGVMKATWTPEDYTQMAWEPSPFAVEDVN